MATIELTPTAPEGRAYIVAIRNIVKRISSSSSRDIYQLVVVVDLYTSIAMYTVHQQEHVVDFGGSRSTTSIERSISRRRSSFLARFDVADALNVCIARDNALAAACCPSRVTSLALYCIQYPGVSSFIPYIDPLYSRYSPWKQTRDGLARLWSDGTDTVRSHRSHSVSVETALFRLTCLYIICCCCCCLSGINWLKRHPNSI